MENDPTKIHNPDPIDVKIVTDAPSAEMSGTGLNPHGPAGRDQRDTSNWTPQSQGHPGSGRTGITAPAGKGR